MNNYKNNRSAEILNEIQKQKITNVSQNQYEYECSKCGLTLVFNRNQTNVICPNDGKTMRRVSR